MKVIIGPYRTWIGPYQIAEKIFWWVDKHADTPQAERVYKFGQWLAQDKHGNDSWLTKFCQWINSFKKRQEYVKLDYYDHWNMDHTLALIIAPLLVQLKNRKQGFGFIDDADVPEELRSTNGTKENEWDWDSLAEKRYEWFLNELIWAFAVHKDDNETDQFYDHSEANDKNDDLMTQVRKIKVDQAGLDAHNKRKEHAFKMFGKYYQTLWD